ncbi:MAG: hypothetical protein ACE5HP_06705 [Gemmatimonadota bacterium]
MRGVVQQASRRRGARGALAGLVAILGLGCASGGTGSAEAVALYGEESPEAVVETFLNAAKRDDYRTMVRLFGTTSGPAERRLGRTDVEQRMFVLAAFLEHQSFSVRRSGLTEGPGRLRLLADMVGTRNGNASVPIVVAEYRGRWFVEQVVTDPLTGTTR